MPKVDRTPVALRPFTDLGMEILEGYEGRSQAIFCQCPFCNEEGRFYANVDDGRWDCKKCSAAGNVFTFYRKLWEISDRSTRDYDILAEDRKLLYPETLSYWGIVQSAITGGWIVPGYSHENKLNQLYRYEEVPDEKVSGKTRKALLLSYGMHHQLFGVPLYHKDKPIVILCEGIWDAIALWEVMRGVKKESDGSLSVTASEAASLLAEVSILAVPSANVFFELWFPFFAGKKVILPFDNDHPKKNRRTGQDNAPAALEGMKRIVRILSASEEPPAEVHYLKWGKDTQYDLEQPDRQDIRDILSQRKTLEERIPLLQSILARIESMPADWLPGRSIGAAKKGKIELQPLPCDRWDKLVNAWQKAMDWIEGLDRFLSIALATITSTPMVGDQIWVKGVGPASCGKSTICEAISVSKKYVLAKSSIRGFHSGYNTDKEGKEDNSLLVLLKNKTLVTKDGDTLLQAPNRDQILAEARDIYDKVSRTHYRNKNSRDYEGYCMTWILCGTESLRCLDSSELGERFLDCVIVEEIDNEQERRIALRIAYRAEREANLISDGKPESREGPEMILAKRLTGGYIQYLRENASELAAEIRFNDRVMEKIVDMATFIAYIRARPSKKQSEKVQREMAFRLTSQLVRLAKFLAVVLNKREIDQEVMRRVRRVATDTARGRTMEIVHWLYRAGNMGLDMRGLVLYTGETEKEMKELVRFLTRIKVINLDVTTVKPGINNRPRWVLTYTLRRLYKVIHDEQLFGA